MFPKYPKIQSVYKRDEKGKILEGQFTKPEFEYLLYNKWIWTEKIDGTNIRVKYDGETFEIRGRTDRAQLHPDLMFALISTFNDKMLELCRKTFEDKEIIFYGEGVGPKIQKRGKYYLKGEYGFILFDILIGNVWLKRDDVEKIAESLDLHIAPVIRKGSLIDAIAYVKDGFKSYFGDFPAEGLVLRPEVEMLDRLGNRIITKVKYVDFNKDSFFS